MLLARNCLAFHVEPRGNGLQKSDRLAQNPSLSASKIATK
jgi:hypothetical protein